MQVTLLHNLPTVDTADLLQAVDMHEENYCVTECLRDYLKQEFTDDIALKHFLVVKLLD